MLRLFRLLLVSLASTVRSRLRRGPLLPSWSFTFEWIIRFLRRGWDETADWPLAAQRADIASRPYPKVFQRKVDVRRETRGGVPVVVFSPRAPRAPGARPCIVYFHGGSYVYGSCTGSHAEVCAHLALATSLDVIGVEYRLAPEHPWPAPLEDARAVCASLGAAPLVLAGDSAGGHLAVMLAGQVAARALVLFSPWVDLDMPGASWHDDAHEIGTRAVLLRHARAVAGARPLASLALANEPLASLPPTYLCLGGAEAARDDILGFAERLRAAGVHVSVHVAADMPHNPPLFEGYHPEGKAAFEAAVAFVAAHAP